MCVPGCLETVGRRLRRRQLLGGAGLAVAAGAASALAPRARAAEPKSFSRVVDLTHTLGPDFPTFDGGSNLEMETMVTLAKDGYNMYRWHLVEHTGTHMDAPIHFGDGVPSADEVPVENLVVPLVVVDIRTKAEDDPDAQVTPDDLQAFEAEHGPIPEGACVAMLSGWDARAGGPEFRNADGDGVMHFPGFHVEAAQYLMSERDVVGIAVDTLSLDHGPSPDFATHYAWLPSNRWGLEGVANLAELPATGATLVVGGPKIKGATGGPSRVLALL
ncbi:MAG TPA: cyclase family protein [Geminicoccaceae bacterium]|nr:cyclase family protein [Geminicoccaceae bacterium]